MRFNRLLALLLCILMLTAFAVGCSTDPEEPAPEENTPTEDPVPEEPEAPEEPTEPEEPAEPEEPVDEFVPTGNVNPLTGLCDGIADTALNRRPVALMVSNSYNSLPQWGISQADIIYEMLAEGRITRFLAIFQDPSKIDKLASIRSSRPYFIDIAQSYGAVYMHFGASVPAYEAIAARDDLVSIDGIKGGWEGTLFFRDPDRRKQIGLEHSVYTTGAYIEEALPKLDASMELEGSPSAFTFHSQHSALEGTDMSQVQLTFSNNHKPYFTYNAENGTYLRFQYGDPHMDAWQEQQIEVKNLLVLRMETRDVPNSSLKLIEVDTTGTGEGYYFCEGKYIAITWKKDAYNSPITFYDSNGEEILFARGKTFVSCVTNTASVDIT